MLDVALLRLRFCSLSPAKSGINPGASEKRYLSDKSKERDSGSRAMGKTGGTARRGPGPGRTAPGTDCTLPRAGVCGFRNVLGVSLAEDGRYRADRAGRAPP